MQKLTPLVLIVVHIGRVMVLLRLFDGLLTFHDKRLVHVLLLVLLDFRELICVEDIDGAVRSLFKF